MPEKTDRGGHDAEMREAESSIQPIPIRLFQKTLPTNKSTDEQIGSLHITLYLTLPVEVHQCTGKVIIQCFGFI
jgi:hypothetical protein